MPADRTSLTKELLGLNATSGSIGVRTGARSSDRPGRVRKEVISKGSRSGSSVRQPPAGAALAARRRSSRPTSRQSTRPPRRNRDIPGAPDSRRTPAWSPRRRPPVDLTNPLVPNPRQAASRCHSGRRRMSSSVTGMCSAWGCISQSRSRSSTARRTVRWGCTRYPVGSLRMIMDGRGRSRECQLADVRVVCRPRLSGDSGDRFRCPLGPFGSK